MASEELEVATSLCLRCTVGTRNWPDGQFVETSEFRFQGVGWILRCRKSRGHCCVWMRTCSGVHPGRSIHYSVHVESSGESGRIEHVLKEEYSFTVRSLESRWWVFVWSRDNEEIERAVPEFRLHGVLKLIVFLKLEDEKCAQTSLTINPVPCSDSLSKDLAKLLDSDSNPDVDFRCGGQSTKAHRLVVSARSPVLATMLQGCCWAEGATGIIKIEDMDLEDLRLFVRYLYTGRLDVLRNGRGPVRGRGQVPSTEPGQEVHAVSDRRPHGGQRVRCPHCSRQAR